MAEVLLFHHAQGLTSGVVAFADNLRAAGHTVHTPDLLVPRDPDDPGLHPRARSDRTAQVFRDRPARPIPVP